MEVRDKPTCEIETNQKLVRAVRFNVNGQYALTGGGDRTIKLWRPSKSLELKCYRGHSDEITDCLASDDSSQLLSSSNDKSLICWDVESGKILRRFRGMAPFNSVCYGGQRASTALVASGDGTVKIFDLRTSNAWDPIQTLTEANDAVTCCRCLGHLIYTTCLDKSLRIYDIRKGSLSIDTMNKQLYHISTGQDGTALLVSVVRGNSILVDPGDGKILNEYKGSKNDLFKIESCYALNDSKVVRGSEEGRVYIWDLDNDQTKGPSVALQHPISAGQLTIIQSISSDSLDLLLTSCNSKIYLWAI